MRSRNFSCYVNMCGVTTIRNRENDIHIPPCDSGLSTRPTVSPCFSTPPLSFALSDSLPGTPAASEQVGEELGPGDLMGLLTKVPADDYNNNKARNLVEKLTDTSIVSNYSCNPTF